MLTRDAILELLPGAVPSAQPLDGESLDEFQLSVGVLEELETDGEIPITMRQVQFESGKAFINYVLFRRREQLQLVIQWSKQISLLESAANTFAAALNTLPDPAVDTEERRETVIEVPELGQVRFTCKRFVSRKGKSQNALGVAEKAEQIG
jgi:hypothetical protein